ncbi:MAG: hypothetical protein HZB29_01880 [Nitrospinae bacterium]|nr:hypothetical protein [Nitrospinota bacterium]
MIVRMKRVRIAGPRSLSAEVINMLYGAGAVHVASPESDAKLAASGLKPELLTGGAAAKLRAAEEMIGQIKTALANLPSARSSDKSLFALPASDDGALAEISSPGPFKEALDRAAAILIEDEAAAAEIKEVGEYKKLYEEFQPLIEKLEYVRGMEITGVTFPPEGLGAYEEMAQRLDEVTAGACALFKGKNHHEGVVALAMYPSSKSEEVRRFVFGHKVRPIHVPERYERETFASTLRFLFSRQVALNDERRGFASELQDVSSLWRENFQEALARLERMLGPLHTRGQLLNSESSFWITGWLPAGEAGRVEHLAGERFSGAVIMYFEDPEPAEFPETPILLRNPAVVRPFERLVQIYSPPMYGTIDPAPLIAISLPMLFGLMLGDVGYAVILALSGWYITRLLPGNAAARDAGGIIYLMAAWSAIWGVFFGEMFGELWQAVGFGEPYFNRRERPIETLLAVVAFGALNVSLGQVCGILVGHRMRDYKRMAVKAADLGVIVSVLWSGWLYYTGEEPVMGVLALGASLLVKGVFGGAEIVETPRLISNILSHARLMALGFASVLVADMAGKAFTSAGGLFTGILMAAGFHALSLAIGLYSPAIQAARLNFVEFLGQFYEFGQVRFSPLKNG